MRRSGTKKFNDLISPPNIEGNRDYLRDLKIKIESSNNLISRGMWLSELKTRSEKMFDSLKGLDRVTYRDYIEELRSLISWSVTMMKRKSPETRATRGS
tara:strand:- start:563 stop:859 length:297 start_codon:yes stop_codon:yes gene_type:complete